MEEDNLEERKKTIEKFSINKSQDEINTYDSSLTSPIIPNKNIIFHDEIHIDDKKREETIDDFDLDINSGGYVYREESAEEKKQKRKKRMNAIIVATLAILASSNLIYKYISVVSKPVPEYKEYLSLKNIQKQENVIEEKKDLVVIPAVTKSINEKKNIQEDLREKQIQYARLEDRRETLKRSIESLSEKQTKSSVTSTIKPSASTSVVKRDKLLSKVWKIAEVRNSGNSVILKMIGYDRYIEVSIGDTIMDAGRISSIRKVNGKWVLNGLKKRVE